MKNITSLNFESDDSDFQKGQEASSWEMSTASQFASPSVKGHSINSPYDNLKEEIQALHREIGQSIGKIIF